MNATRAASQDEETATEARLVVDPRGQIRRANGAALALLGYRQDELLGRPLALILPADLQKLMRAFMATSPMVKAHGVVIGMNYDDSRLT